MSEVEVTQLGDGDYIATGSFEDLAEFERKNQEAALAALTPDQRALLDGRAFCFFRYMAGEELSLFGKVKSLDELAAETRARWDPEDGPVEDQIESYADLRSRGFAFAETFSAWMPTGELGDVHLSTIVEITPEAFESARKAEWLMENLVHIDVPAYMQCADRWNTFVTKKWQQGGTG